MDGYRKGVIMSCELTKEQVVSFVNEYGSPLYVFHAEEFKKTYLNLLNTMQEIYPKYNIAYSYKTNYTPKIITLVKQFGGLAEVVSEMEYKLAKKIGYSNKSIVYNGPVKGKALFEHLAEGGVANIDSLDELMTVIEFAKKHNELNLEIAFRVNIDIKQGYVSRFGIDAYEEETQNAEIDKAFEMVNNQSNIAIVGLHCHVGRSRSIDAWKNRVRIIFKLIDRYFNSVPKFIDLGSGMNSVMEPILACQFNGYIPTFSEYAEVVAGAMKEKYGFLPLEEQPLLITEPGTTLISGCMSFIGTVKTIKNVKGKNYVTFNCCGGNMGDICHLKQLPITVYHMSKEVKKLEDATFVGYTCLEHDHIYENFNGELAVGDLVQFRNVGSYSNVFKPPFILPNCAMIQCDEKGISLMKRAENIDDLFHTYVF